MNHTLPSPPRCSLLSRETRRNSYSHQPAMATQPPCSPGVLPTPSVAPTPLGLLQPSSSTTSSSHVLPCHHHQQECQLLVSQVAAADNSIFPAPRLLPRQPTAAGPNHTAVLLMSIIWSMLPWDNTTYYGQHSCFSSNNCIQHRKGGSFGPCNSIYNSSNTIHVRLNATSIFKNNPSFLPDVCVLIMAILLLLRQRGKQQQQYQLQGTIPHLPLMTMNASADSLSAL